MIVAALVLSLSTCAQALDFDGRGHPMHGVVPLPARVASPDGRPALFAITPALEAEVLARLREMFARLRSTAEENDALRTTALSVRDTLRPNAIAEHHVGRVILGREGQGLRKALHELRAAGAPESHVLELLAAQYIPAVAHELRHELDRRRLGAPLHVIELEQSAFVTEFAAHQEARELFPEAFRYPTFLTSAYEEAEEVWDEDMSPDDILSALGGQYVILGVYSLSMLMEDSLGMRSHSIHSLEHDISRFKRLVDEYAALERSGEPTFALDRMANETSRGLAATKDELGVHVNELQRQLKALRDDRQLAQAADYFKRDRCRAWELWKRRYPERFERHRDYLPDHCLDGRLGTSPSNSGMDQIMSLRE